MPSLRTGDVFVPGRAPVHTYNPRSDMELETRLAEYLEDGGSVLALVGPTKTGKSVLLKQNLDAPIWIDGHGVSGAGELWSLVGAELGVFSEAQLERDSTQSTTVVARAKAIVLEGGGDHTEASGSRQVFQAVLAPAQEVKSALLASGRTLVIDDFHFLEPAAQTDIVRAVKPLVFDGLRAVFAAISHRRHDVPTVVEDMVGRVTPLEIELWSVAELLVIARKGFDALRVVDPGDRIATRLAEMSFGSPHLMQKLCRELVRDVNGISAAQDEPVTLREPADWPEFFRRQVERASERWFTRLLRGPQERTGRNSWTLKDGRSVDAYGLVLKAIGDSGPELNLSKDRIRALVEETVNGKPPEPHQITRVLQHMSRIAAKRLTEEQPTEESLEADAPDLFSGVQPVVEYVDAGPNSMLHIADPFFAFYIRWGVERHLPVSEATTDAPLDLP